MANQTVNDILGKGFKFEQTAETRRQTPPAGTVAVGVGVADWGEVNVPTYITRGANQFEQLFGQPRVEPSLDTVGLAFNDHFRNSQVAYFTRISDGTDAAAESVVNKLATTAKALGEDSLTGLRLSVIPFTEAGGNNKFRVAIGNNGAPQTIQADLPTSTKAGDIISDDTTAITTSIVNGTASIDYDYAVNDIVQFTIDGTSYTYIVQSGDAFTNLENTVINNWNDGNTSYTYADAWASAAIAEISGVTINIVDSSNGSVIFKSATRGTSSSVRVQNADNLFSSAPATTQGSDVDISSIVTTINNAIGTLGSASLNVDGFLLVASDGTGSASSVEITQTNEVRYTAVESYDGLATSAVVNHIPANNITELSASKVFHKNATTGIETLLGEDATTAGTIDDLASGIVDVSGSTAIANTFTVALGGTPGTAGTLSTDAGVDLTDNVTISNDIQTLAATGPYGFTVSDGTKTAEVVFYTNDSADFNSVTTWQAYLINAINGAIGYTFASTNVNDGIDLTNETGEATTPSISSPTTAGVVDITSIFGTTTSSAGSDPINMPAVGDSIFVEFETDDVEANAILGVDAIQDTVFLGDDTQLGPKFEAVRTGELGNTIRFVKIFDRNGYQLQVFFNGTLVENFVNYSYNKSDANYIGTLINTNINLQDIVTFDDTNAATYTDGGNDFIFEFAEGEFSLSGGNSGTAGITDNDYVQALDKYKDVKLYSFDVIVASGNSSQVVAEKLEEICSSRKDCFTILDPPFGLNTSTVINWHNGLGSGRDKQLNNIYSTVYWPWVYAETNGTTNYVWQAPSTKVLGAITQADFIVGHRFSAPAGELRTKMDGIQSLEQFLTPDDEVQLYADEYGNNINPISFTNVDGYFIDGQKTTSRANNKLNRINVMRSSLYIKKEIQKIVKFYFWQPSDPKTWKDFRSAITIIMDFLVDRRAIQSDYQVICDGTTNTREVIDKNGLVAVINYRPIGVVEKIKVVSNIIEDNLNVEVTA